MRKTIIATLLLATSVTAPVPALAWDYPGHRIVGAIADLVLKQHYEKTHKRVSDLLEIARGRELRQGRSLSESAVFPDCAKNNNEPFCNRPPSDEEKAYAEHNPKHNAYHFTDVPLRQPGYSAGLLGTEDLDVVHMINFIVDYLRTTEQVAPDRPSKKGVRLNDTEAIWLLAHLVGDIHQPLHVGAKYFDKECQNEADPNTAGGMGNVAQTFGGNLIYITPAEPAVPPAANLHFYWDGAAVVLAMRKAGLLSSEQEYAKALAATPPKGWQTSGKPETWATTWANEALSLAIQAHDRLDIRKGTKRSPFFGTGGCTWETTIDAAYQEWAATTAEDQIKKAGFRLAALLVAIFPNK